MNPLIVGWKNQFEYDGSIVVYRVFSGQVFGGSNHKKTVFDVAKDPDRFHPGGDFKMELDLSKRSFTVETNGHKIIIDDNLGDLEYSPIVILSSAAPQVTLL